MVKSIKHHCNKSSTYSLETISFFDATAPRSLKWTSEETYSMEDIHRSQKYKSLSSKSKKVNRSLPLNIRSHYNKSGVVKNGRKAKKFI